MIALLETYFTAGDDPAEPNAGDIALEADVTFAEAQAMLSASWAMIEAFTGRCYRPTTSGKVIVKAGAPITFRWPRFPYPAAITVEAYTSGFWAAVPASYVAEAGVIDLEPFTLYRLTQTGPVAGAEVTAGVAQAAHYLALYQLIQGPNRREYRSQASGDFSYTRESLLPVFRGSGAGALLAQEVRL